MISTCHRARATAGAVFKNLAARGVPLDEARGRQPRERGPERAALHASENRWSIMTICLCLGMSAPAFTQTGSLIPQQKGAAMTKHASGTFDVKVTPQAPEPGVGDPTVGRMSIDKVFHGDLDGTSLGQMLTAMTDVKDSAGYVAIERVKGVLKGRRGTFALQHTGIMDRGVSGLVITVVPDSGTGQLAGLTGTMTIDVRDGKHFYTFDYTLP